LIMLLIIGAWVIHPQNTSGSDGANDFFTYGVGVYVSEVGSDYYEGTKERPFRTLKKALDYIKISGKKIIFVDSGTYYIDSSLNVRNDLEILGPSYWKRESDKQEKTVIESWAPYGKGESMFSVEKAQFTIKGMTIRDLYKHFPFLVAANGGALYCEKVDFHYSSQGRCGAIFKKGGVLTFHNSSVYAHDSAKSQAVACESAEVEILDTEIKGPENSNDFTAVVCTAGSKIISDNLTICPGKGKRLTGISLSGSTFKLSNSKILSGQSSHSSTCLEAKTSAIILNKVLFECDTLPYKITAVNTSESEVTIHNSRFLLEARSGLQAVHMSGGKIDLQNSYFNSKLAQEYMYTINLEQVRGDCFNNILTGGQAPDSVNIVLSDAPTKWLNNTIVGGTGSNITIGILIRGVEYPVLINNILTRKKPARGIALYLTTYEETPFYLLANNLSGWEVFLKYANVPKTKNYTAVTTVIRTIEELNHYDLVPFGGTIDINISETYENTFQTDESPYYRLKISSRCVDAGLDVNTRQFKGPAVDYDGNPRPNLKGDKPFYDIGAFEYQ
jgi:hypothetical protein